MNTFAVMAAVHFPDPVLGSFLELRGVGGPAAVVPHIPFREGADLSGRVIPYAYGSPPDCRGGSEGFAPAAGPH